MILFVFIILNETKLDKEVNIIYILSMIGNIRVVLLCK